MKTPHLSDSKTIGYPYSIHFLRSILGSASTYHFPIAIWKLPYQKPRHFAVDLSGKAQKVSANYENLPSGFLVSPFLTKGNDKFFIRADIYYSSENETLQYDFSTEVYGSEKKENRQVFAEKFQTYFHKLGGNFPTIFPSKSNIESKNTYQNFIQTVEKSVQAIQNQAFNKVVLSRQKVEQLPSNFDVIATFERLCEVYPHAFVSLVSIPEVGVWLGASPEILVSLDKNGIFRTVSLAGTQHRSVKMDIREARWSQKEIEEQALVSRYIINCFKKIRLREFEEVGPKTVVAGNLLHLRTDFKVDTKAVHFPELATVMTELLHPTSAVCGMPKEEALKFIQTYENYDRELYSGFLGPVNIQDETRLFVNLRCMQIFENQGIFYAGAGITEDSIPEKEWQETELKCQTLSKLIYG